jgi:hypothetical protein
LPDLSSRGAFLGGEWRAEEGWLGPLVEKSSDGEHYSLMTGPPHLHPILTNANASCLLSSARLVADQNLDSIISWEHTNNTLPLPGLWSTGPVAATTSATSLSAIAAAFIITGKIFGMYLDILKVKSIWIYLNNCVHSDLHELS